MRLTELLRGCNSSIGRTAAPHVDDDPELLDITFDSRQARPGSLFVALSGAHSDGHDFVRTAVDAGAAAVLIATHRRDDFADLATVVLDVGDPRQHLGELAAVFFDTPADELHVIGITGTNGKTTITYLIEAVLQHARQACGVIGTVNYRWPGHVEQAPNTTPESLIVQRLLRRMCDDGVGAVAMEVSSHGLATHRLSGTEFDVAIFTNLSQDHLDFHQTMEAYRNAKRTLFTDRLRAEGGVAVVNVDDPEGRQVAALVGARAVTTSARGHDATWSCTSWDQRLELTSMEVASPHGALIVETRLLGEFNVSNVLQTLAATSAIGVDPQVAADALRELRGVPGRLEHIGGDGIPHVFVDYAHTPDALERALAALRPLTAGRLVVVFGCGGDRDRDKRPRMGAVASAGADAVVVTSDNPRSESPEAIIAQIERGISATDAVSIVDRAAAIRHAIAAASRHDVILIAGKGHETYQERGGVRRPFDDIEHAHRALESWS